MTEARRPEPRYHTLIPERSAVLVSVRTSVGPVTFGANGLEGFITVAVHDDGINPAVAPAAHLELLVSRLTSGNSAYDAELHRQVDGRRFPTAYVDLHAVEAAASSKVHVRGEVTLRGITVPADGVVVVEVPQPGLIVITGDKSFNISDFGIPPPSLFMIKIDPEIQVRLYLEARAEPT